MWYAIQTKTGREQELQDLLKKYRDETGYRNCFQLKRETVRRYQGDCIIYTETLFPGYLFVDTDDPLTLYVKLKKTPKFSKLLGREEISGAEDDEEPVFHAISSDEQKFLENLMGDDAEYVVRLSPVEVDEERNITKCGGALAHYKDGIVKKRIRLRYVVIRLTLLGRTREVKLGIRLKGDKTNVK